MAIRPLEEVAVQDGREASAARHSWYSNWPNLKCLQGTPTFQLGDMQEDVCRWINEHNIGDTQEAVQEAVCRWIDEHDVQEAAGGCVLVD